MRQFLTDDFPTIAKLDHEPTMSVIHAQIQRLSKHLVQPHAFFPSVHAISKDQPESFTLPRQIDGIPTSAMLRPIIEGRTRDPASRLAMNAGVRYAIQVYSDYHTSIPAQQFDTLIGVAASLHVTPTERPQIIFVPTRNFNGKCTTSERRLVRIARVVAACSIVPFERLKDFCKEQKIESLNYNEQITTFQIHKTLVSHIMEYAPRDLAVILHFLSTQPSIEAAIHAL